MGTTRFLFSSEHAVDDRLTIADVRTAVPCMILRKSFDVRTAVPCMILRKSFTVAASCSIVYMCRRA